MGVENSSILQKLNTFNYLVALHFPNRKVTHQPRSDLSMTQGTLVTLSTNGCFCATVKGTLPFIPAKWSNLRIYPSLPPVNTHRISVVAAIALTEVACGAARTGTMSYEEHVSAPFCRGGGDRLRIRDGGVEGCRTEDF
jgi:hypothetical protein